MSTSTAGRGRRGRHNAAPRSSTRRRVVIAVSLGLGVVLLVAVGCAAWVGHRALVAKDALQAAQVQITDVKRAIGQPDAPSTAQLYAKLAKNTRTAVEQTDDPLWSFTEGVPFVGPNLRAFRRIAQLTHTLVTTGVQPIAVAADGLSIDSLKPKDGAIDIAPLRKLTPAMVKLDDALRAADASAGAIDTKGVLPQLKDPLAKLRQTIEKALPVTGELRKVLPVLYPALGGDGTRHYLLIFQNNAEERASGGNPAALAMLDVDHGRVKLGKQPSSQDFPHPYTVPPLTWEGDWARIYGPHTSTYETNITFTPDFPQVARMARAMWRTEFGGRVDGVVSFDPIALSYLMRATGPIKLPTGERLTSDNAVKYLLSDVYARYIDPRMQDAVFASAAQAIFKAVTNGQGDLKAYVAQLKPMLDEQRLKAWSVRTDEEDLLLTSQAGNMLPPDNTKATVFGVYNNDDATSKMSYYMDATVNVTSQYCPAKAPRYSLSTVVTNTLKRWQVHQLTDYVIANQKRILPGGDRQWVYLYGPVGAKLVAAYLDGEKVRFGTDQDWHLNTVPDATGLDDHKPAVRRRLYGRPVAMVSIKLYPGEHATVRGVFTGGADDSRTLEVSHTPKVRAVPVTYKQSTACG